LNEFSIEDISLKNCCSKIIIEHFDHNLMDNDMLEVDKIGGVEKESSISSLNISTNEEVDKDGIETNCVPFCWSNFS